jgi:hypothetical protein
MGKDTNTLGNLISHILGAGQFAVTDRIGGQSMPRDRNAEFTAPVTREMFNQRRTDIEARVCDTPTKLSPQRRRTPEIDGRLGGTIGLLNLGGHFLEVVGQ